MTTRFSRLFGDGTSIVVQELDNGNPEVDDGAALINTVIRACKSAG